MTQSVECSFSGEDPKGFFISNDRAYVANANGGLYVATLGSGSAEILPSTSSYNPYDACISGRYAYLATDDGVVIFDIETGVKKGEWPNTDGTYAAGICVSGSYAYALYSDYGETNMVVVLDVSDVDHPYYEGAYPVSTIYYGGICVSGGKIYVGTSNGLDVFSIGSSGSLSPLSPISGISNVHDVYVVDNAKAYVTVTSGSDDYIKVYDISNPNSILPVDNYNNGGVTTAGVFFYGGKIYYTDGEQRLAKLQQGTNSLTVTLDTGMESSQTFSFSSEGLGDFTLDRNSGSSTYPTSKAFSNIANGTYIIRQTVPSSWTLSSIASSDTSKAMYSSDGSSWHPTFAAGDTYAKVTVQSGSSLTLTFADGPAVTTSTISGHVIYDLDGSGTKNNLESYVPDGWKTELYKNGASTAVATNTSFRGAYSFSNLDSGNYEVKSVLPSGWSHTVPSSGSRSYSSLSSNQINQDFGARGSLSISGKVFYDLDSSGTMNDLEMGLTGRTVQLVNTTSSSIISEVTSTAGGSYQFDSIAPGSYSINVVAPTNWQTTNSPINFASLPTSASDQNLGLKGQLQISGHAYFDQNANGAKDGQEPYLSNWQIQLYSASLGGIIAQKTTPADGSFSFANVAPGSYELRQALPSADWTCKTPTGGKYTYSSLSSSQSNQDFGNHGSLSISGHVYFDMDVNGAKNGQEPYLKNWVVQLYDTSLNSVIAEQTTPVDGSFSFNNIPPGAYELREQLPSASWMCNTPTGAKYTYSSLTQSQSDQDFGNYGSLSITGHVYYDQNANGAKDGLEAYLNNWVVQLYDTNTASVIAERTTSSDGSFSFASIGPGSYELRQVLAADWTSKTPDGGKYIYSPLSSSKSNQDFGNHGSLSVSGHVYYDLDADGTKDGQEPYLNNWVVQLYDTGLGSVIAEQTTPSDGSFSFGNIAPGAYELRQVLAADWTCNTPDGGKYIYSSLSSSKSNQDFGNHGSLSVSGHVYYDRSADGAKDDQEPYLSNWVVQLYNTSLGSVIAEQTTPSDGSFSFGNIAPGMYELRQQLPSAYWTCKTPEGGKHIYSPLSSSRSNQDFGNHGSLSLSGHVYYDQSANGAKDGQEPYLSNLVVQLYNTSLGSVIDEKTTSSDGSFSFANLVPGAYEIRQQLPSADWTCKTPTGGKYTYSLLSSTKTSQDFGNHGSLSISGQVIYDLDGSGALNGNEIGVSSASLKLFSNDFNVNIASSSTNGLGEYELANLVPGSYVLSLEKPADDWSYTVPANGIIEFPTLDASLISQNFGIRGTNSISGRVFYDVNGNANRDTLEPYLKDQTIKLYQGSFSTGTLIAQATTDDSGNYEFANLGSGNYYTVVEPSSGWVVSSPPSPSLGRYSYASFAGSLSDQDFGLRGQMSISGTAFYDIDDDGSKGSNEPILNSWQVQIYYTDAGGSSSQISSTSITSGYLFDGLAAGNYQVTLVIPSTGWKCAGNYPSSFDVVLTAGGSNAANKDFAALGTLRLGGKVFYDINDNGSPDSGEPGLEGWTVKLDGSTYGSIAETETDASGDYLFLGVSPDTWTVSEVPASGWVSRPPVGDSYLLNNLAADRTDLNFANYGTITLAGKKYYDLDGNSAKGTDEPYLSGWKFNLVSTTYGKIAETETDSIGTFTFSRLPPGSWQVTEELPAGWIAKEQQGSYSYDSLASDPDVEQFGNTGQHSISGRVTNNADASGLGGWTVKLKNTTQDFTLQTTTDTNGHYSFSNVGPGSWQVSETVQSGWVALDPDSGLHLLNVDGDVTAADFVNQGDLTISGKVFNNRNGNGLAIWTVRLSGTTISGRSISAVTTTDSSGHYSFTGLEPGDYLVAEDLVSGWSAKEPESGSIDLGSLSASQTDADFANKVVDGLSISGKKYNDLDASGGYSAGDETLNGWQVLLQGTTLDGESVSLDTTTASGAYSFSGLSAGDYTVSETAKNGWTCSEKTSKQVSIRTAGAEENFFNLVSSNLKVSGGVFSDRNGNSEGDAGEGIQGWKVSLTGTTLDGKAVSLEQTTDAQGSYSFPNLKRGTYSVKEESKPGIWEAIGPDFADLNLEADATANFVNRGVLSISGVKYNDTDGNAARESGEEGLAGWEIKLSGEHDISLSDITAADGSFEFTNLEPGDYLISEVDQDNWQKTEPAGDSYAVELVDTGRSDLKFGNRKELEVLTVKMSVSSPTVMQGGTVTFTTVINSQGTVTPDSVDVTQVLPKGLKFVSSTPPTSSSTINSQKSASGSTGDSSTSAQSAADQSAAAASNGGTTLTWTGLKLDGSGGSPQTTIAVVSQVQYDATGTLDSQVTVSGSSTQAFIAEVSDRNETTVQEQSPINLNKTSDLNEVRQGGYVTYTISYGSRINLSNVNITENAPDDLEFVSATPAPYGGTENVWIIDNLAADVPGQISVLYRIKERANLSYESRSSVQGSGYVNSYRRFSTETNIRITNSVTLKCSKFPPVTTSHSVKLRDAEGTTLLEKEHGSGDFNAEEQTILKMKNRSIRTEGSLKAEYKPTSFALPGNRKIDYNSMQSATATTRNRATGASTSQGFHYAKSIEMQRHLLLDRNETDLAIEAHVQGQARVGVIKKEHEKAKSTPIFESSGDFSGSFSINRSLEDYGSNVRMFGNTSGLGQVESDLRLKKSQRSFEHGSGFYRQDVLASTPESYVARDLNVSYDPQYGYDKWEAGIWSKSPSYSFLGHEVTGADYIREETKAEGLNDMSVNLSFQGTARLRAVSESQDTDVNLDEVYAGQYSLKRKVHLGGVSRFDRPHLSLTKTGQILPQTTVADYTITVLNDGNTALGPVYVWDVFPAGTDYLGSSFKPTKLANRYANWSLLHLGIGQSVKINLQLNVTDRRDELVNVVYASGGHNDDWVTAGNMSVIQFAWLGCCEPQMLVEKQARIDAADSQIIWYRILLSNRANVGVVARITDTLPTGLQLLNASAEPQVEGRNFAWLTDAIPAGESRFIEYQTRAATNGRFVNTARIEAHALDGSGGTTALASAVMQIGEATSYSEAGWRPPDWGLDRSEMICDEGIAGEGASCTTGGCP